MNDIHLALKSFDEAKYLEQNPDVHRAVQNKSLLSGWEHYIFHGYNEQRAGVSPEVRQAVKDIMEHGPVVPPGHLRKRIHGNENIAAFEAVGRITTFNIFAAIHPKMDTGNGPYRIFDFGCGCGRVIRFLHKIFENCAFSGSDIDKDAIAWNRENLSYIGEFVANEILPPLPFEAEAFDFIYSISVFTHLPEDMQFMWLEELRRVSKPNGYLLLTTHGEHLLDSAPEALKKELQDKGFYYSVGDGTEGLPDFYQTTFHTESYIRTRWSKYFEIERIVKKGIAGHQDLIFCKRRG